MYIHELSPCPPKNSSSRCLPVSLTNRPCSGFFSKYEPDVTKCQSSISLGELPCSVLTAETNSNPPPASAHPVERPSPLRPAPSPIPSGRPATCSVLAPTA